MRHKAYVVMWKRQDEWIAVYETDRLSDAERYAEASISRGHTTQRIEIWSQSAEGVKGDVLYVEFTGLRNAFKNMK